VDAENITVTQYDDTTATVAVNTAYASGIDVDNYLGAGGITLQGVWDGESDANKNTFVDANTTEIEQYIYDTQVDAVLSRMSGLVAAETAAIRKFVISQIKSTNWDKIDDFAHYGLQTEANSLKGWKMKTQTAVNAPTHTPGTGYAFNGSTQYLKSAFIPSSDGVEFTRDDCLVGAFVVDNQDTGTNVNILGSNNTTQIWMVQQYGVQLVFRLNGGAWNVSAVTTGFPDNTWCILSRTASDRIEYRQNTTLIASAATATNNDVTGELYIAASNEAGSPARYINASLSSFIVASAIDFNHANFYSNLTTLNTELAAV